MKPPFKLDAHPRRPQPLSEPPAGYFDQLPMRVMARLPQADARASSPSWHWLAFLSPALRTGLASVALLGSFAASFYLSNSASSSPAAATLAAVPHTELVSYLLDSGARVEHSDLAVLTASNPTIAQGFLQASEEELTDALDAQPSDELTYL